MERLLGEEDGRGGRLRAREQEKDYILNLEETKENKNVN